MGITIHYKGKLDSAERIDPFLEEMEDIAKSMEWNYTLIEKDRNDLVPVKGLFIQPHSRSEFLTFACDEDGYLRNAINLEHFKNDVSYSFNNHIKTQFAPVEIHIAVIRLLRYVKEKFIADLEVYDEGQYWETDNINILQKQFEVLNAMMDKLEDILNSIPFDKNKNADSIADKIEKILKNRSGKK